MQVKALLTNDSGWPIRVSTQARIAIFFVLTVLVGFEIYAGWQGAQISALAREATGSGMGEVTGAYQASVNQAYVGSPGSLGLLGFLTWLMGMTGFFGFSLGLYFLSGLSLIGAVPKWWARGAVLGAGILVSIAWQYADVINQLGYLLD